MQVEEDGIEHCGLPLVFTLAMLSFHGARPRGAADDWFEDDDQFTAADMLRHPRFERGKLHLGVDHLRGRCVKTTVEADAAGKVFLETVNRGVVVRRIGGQVTLSVEHHAAAPHAGIGILRGLLDLLHRIIMIIR